MMPGAVVTRYARGSKADDATRGIPIICLTERNRPGSATRVFRSGRGGLSHETIRWRRTFRSCENPLELKHTPRNDASRENELREEMGRALVREHELLEVTAKLEETNRVLRRLSLVDGLTKIANRRQFDIILDKELRRCARQKVDLSLVMIDIDFFKSYNDHYGHVAGDDCLRLIAAALARNARRPADLAARYGGEEFAVILPETSLQGAALIAEGIRNEIFELNMSHEDTGGPRRVTVSAGVACVPPTYGAEPSDVIKKADNALYTAKREGRNRIAVSKE